MDQPHEVRSAGQAMRQTLLKKYAKIRSDMERLHNSRMSPYETMECHEAIRAEIAACWRTDEIRRTKPTPQAGHPCASPVPCTRLHGVSVLTASISPAAGHAYLKL